MVRGREGCIYQCAGKRSLWLVGLSIRVANSSRSPAGECRERYHVWDVLRAGCSDAVV